MAHTENQGYTPKPALVCEVKGGTNQHRFTRGRENSYHLDAASESPKPSRCWREDVGVVRFANSNLAQLDVALGTTQSSANLTIELTPNGLRDLAYRLLDAASDIETHPAFDLMQGAAA